MKKRSGIVVLFFLIANLLFQPIAGMQQVLAEQEEAESAEIIDDVEDYPQEGEVDLEVPADETEAAAEVEEEKDPVTSLTYLPGHSTEVIEGESTAAFAFNMTNLDNTLKDALLRVRVAQEHLKPYSSVTDYFYGHNLDSNDLSARTEGNDLVVEYEMGDLADGYDQDIKFSFDVEDQDAVIPVQAEIIQNNSVRDATPPVHYQVTAKEAATDSSEETMTEEEGESDEDDESDPEDEEEDPDQEADIAPLAEVGVNLLTSFEMKFRDYDGNITEIANGAELEFDVTTLNSVQLSYGLTKPDGLEIAEGDTYTIDLPAFYQGTFSAQPIFINGIQVGTYTVGNGQLVITFDQEVNNYDNVEMYITGSGDINIDVFDEEDEVVVEVPFQDGTSYTATIRAEQQEYDGEDTKTAGRPYILNDDDSQTETN